MSSSAEPPMVVCVLGMSRTGSSLTTRVLNLAGVYLGPEEELLQKELRQLAGEGESVIARASEANPEGFWEHYRIMRLNERILRALGGSWRNPPSPPPGWESSGEFAAEREEARALLTQSFDDQRLWGWKDPRNSLTLPFWQQLLPAMRYVICLRNPMDVAASLERRDGTSLEQGVALWLTYVASALVNTSGRPRIFISYESHFDDPRGTAARLAGFVGRDGALDAEVWRQLAGVIDERLWRHRTATQDVVRDSRVPAVATSLHLLTELLAASQLDALGGSSDSDVDLQKAVDLYAKQLLDGNE
jgi:hypothetical protein